MTRCSHFIMAAAANPNGDAKGRGGLIKEQPDLLVISGRVWIAFIERKAATGHFSYKGKLFRNLCASMGIRFIDTYGRDDPIALFECWKILRPQIEGRVA